MALVLHVSPSPSSSSSHPLILSPHTPSLLSSPHPPSLPVIVLFVCWRWFEGKTLDERVSVCCLCVGDFHVWWRRCWRDRDREWSWSWLTDSLIPGFGLRVVFSVIETCGASDSSTFFIPAVWMIFFFGPVLSLLLLLTLKACSLILVTVNTVSVSPADRLMSLTASVCVCVCKLVIAILLRTLSFFFQQINTLVLRTFSQWEGVLKFKIRVRIRITVRFRVWIKD